MDSVKLFNNSCDSTGNIDVLNNPEAKMNEMLMKYFDQQRKLENTKSKDVLALCDNLINTPVKKKRRFTQVSNKDKIGRMNLDEDEKNKQREMNRMQKKKIRDQLDEIQKNKQQEISKMRMKNVRNTLTHEM